MKKLFVFLLALTVIGTTVFAQDAKKASPEAKYGFSGSFEMDLVKGAKSDTFDGSYEAKNVVAKDNPDGLKVTAFKVNPWLSLDWSKVSFKAEAKYDGFDADDTDFSSMNLTTIVKDIYGLELKSEVTADNKRSGNSNYKGNAENPPDVYLGALDHNITATYKTEGYTFYTKYGFVDGVSDIRDGNVLVPLDFVGNFLDGFKEIGWTMDTEGLGASLVLENTTKTTYAENQKIADAATYAAAYALWITNNAVDPVNPTALEKAAAHAAGLADVAAATPVADGDNWAVSGAAIARTNMIKDAWIEARNMFGIWTSRVNGGAMKLRQPNLGLDVSEDRDDVSNEFEVNRQAPIYAEWLTNDDGDAKNPALYPLNDRGTNFLNTVKINDALTAKVGMVVPYATTSFVDWLKSDKLVVGVDYALAGVGKLSAGSLINSDYVTKFDQAKLVVAQGANLFDSTIYPVVYMEGPSLHLANYLANGAASSYVADGTGFWFDATVTEAVPGMKLFASVDVQFGSYVDIPQFVKDATAGKGTAEKPLTLSTVGTSMWNLGLEAAYTVMDPLTVSAALYTGVAMGFEYEAFTGDKWKDVEDPKLTYPNGITGSWAEEDWVRATSEVKPFILKVRADYKVNDTVSVWASNAFTANSNYFYDGGLDDGDESFSATGVKPLYGYFSKNTIGAGAKFAASKNASLKIGAEFNMYTAPALSFETGATPDQKTVAEKSYEIFKAANLDPFKVTAAFSYTY